MNIKPIKNLKDYSQALKRIDKLWEAKKNTVAGDELDVLATLVENYEAKHYPMLPPEPAAAIKFRLEQLGYEQKDLARIIGANRASEILHKKRRPSLEIVKILHNKLNIPAEALIG